MYDCSVNMFHVALVKRKYQSKIFHRALSKVFFTSGEDNEIKDHKRLISVIRTKAAQ